MVLNCIVSTPTNYDEKTSFFDTSSVEDVIKKVKNANQTPVL